MKLLIILAVSILSIIFILPTVGVNDLEIVLDDSAGADKIELIKKRFPESRFTMTVDGKTVNVSGFNINDAVMNEILKTEDYPFVKSAKIKPHWAEAAVWAKRIALGLDLQGGSMLVLQADYERMEQSLGRKLNEKEKTEVLNQALEVLPERINPYGVREPIIRIRGTDSIELQMPGVRDPEAVKKILGMTGIVEYRLVDDALSKKAEAYIVAQKLDYVSKDADIKAVIKKVSDGIQLPADKIVLFMYSPDKFTKKLRPMEIMVLDKKVSLAGSDIQNAKPDTDSYGRLVVGFSTTAEGAQKFAEATSKNIGKRLAIVIDDAVRSAPTIQTAIRDGGAQITGDFTEEEVNMLVRIIKEGALPVSLKIAEERTVGPSMGQDAINAGVKAGAVAIIAIAVFMIVYYKFAGIIAIIGLVLNAVYALAMLSMAGFTLTLPGLAGFVLTLGMAVDANVIIYERIREEIRLGRNVKTAITLGFEKAFWTIFDSNLTTVLAAIILSMVGTGPIKGYAVTLTIGIIANMFVALYVTKFYYMLKASGKEIKKLSI